MRKGASIVIDYRNKYRLVVFENNGIKTAYYSGSAYSQITEVTDKRFEKKVLHMPKFNQSVSEGLIMKYKVKGSGFSVIATSDGYFAPQILEINYR